MTLNLTELIVRSFDEIALEGSRGCKLSQLWNLLRRPQYEGEEQLPDFSEAEKSLIWHGIQRRVESTKDLKFTFDDEPSHPEMDSVTLDNSMSVKVLEEKGLLITACESLRLKALGMLDTFMLSSDMMIYLEVIGRHRQNGLTSIQAKAELPPEFKGDLHYCNEVLLACGAIHRRMVTGQLKYYYLARFSFVYRYDEHQVVKQFEAKLSGGEDVANRLELPSKLSAVCRLVGNLDGLVKKKQLRRILDDEWCTHRSKLERVPGGAQTEPETVVLHSYHEMTTVGLDPEQNPRDSNAGLLRELTTFEHIEWAMSENNWSATNAYLANKLQIRYKKVAKLMEVLSNDAKNYSKHAVMRKRNKAIVLTMKPELREKSRFRNHEQVLTKPESSDMNLIESGQQQQQSIPMKQDTHGLNKQVDNVQAGSSVVTPTQEKHTGVTPERMTTTNETVPLPMNKANAPLSSLIPKRERDRKTQVLSAVKQQRAISMRQLFAQICERETKEGYGNQMDRKTLKKLIKKIEKETGETFKRCLLKYENYSTMCIVDKTLTDSELCELLHSAALEIPKTRIGFQTRVGRVSDHDSIRHPNTFMGCLKKFHQVLVESFSNQDDPGDRIPLPSYENDIALMLPVSSYLSVFPAGALSPASMENLTNCIDQNRTVAETCQLLGVNLRPIHRTFITALELLGIVKMMVETEEKENNLTCFRAKKYMVKSIDSTPWFPDSWEVENETLPLATLEDINDCYSWLELRVFAALNILPNQDNVNIPPPLTKDQLTEFPWLNPDYWMVPKTTTAPPTKRVRRERYKRATRRSRGPKRPRTSSVLSDAMNAEDNEVGSKDEERVSKTKVSGSSLDALRDTILAEYLKEGSNAVETVIKIEQVLPDVPRSQIEHELQGMFAKSTKQVSFADGALVLFPYDVPFGDHVRYMMTERRILQVLLLIHVGVEITPDRIEKAFGKFSRSQVVSSVHDLETVDLLRKAKNGASSSTDIFEKMLSKEIILSDKFLQPLHASRDECKLDLLPHVPRCNPHNRLFECCKREQTESSQHSNTHVMSVGGICNRCLIALSIMTYKKRVQLGALVPGNPAEPQSGHPKAGTAPIVPLHQLPEFEPLSYTTVKIEDHSATGVAREDVEGYYSCTTSQSFPWVKETTDTLEECDESILAVVEKALDDAGDVGLSLIEIAVALKRRSWETRMNVVSPSLQEEARALSQSPERLSKELKVANTAIEWLTRKGKAMIVPLLEAQARVVSMADPSYLQPWLPIGRHSSIVRPLLLWQDLDGNANSSLLAWLRSAVLYALLKSAGGMSLGELFSRLEPTLGLWDLQILVRGMVKEQMLLAVSESTRCRISWTNAVEFEKQTAGPRRTMLSLGPKFYDVLSQIPNENT